MLENNLPDKHRTHLIDAATTKVRSRTPSQFSYQVCGLLKYSLSILCFTNSGNEQATLPLQVQTLEDVPDEVTEIAFLKVYDTSVDIGWGAPLHPQWPHPFYRHFVLLAGHFRQTSSSGVGRNDQ